MKRGVCSINLLAALALFSCGELEKSPAETCAVEGASLDLGESTYDPFLCQRCTCAHGGRFECAPADCPGPGEPEASAFQSPPRAPTRASIRHIDADERVERCFDRDGDGFYGCVDPMIPQRPHQIDCDDNLATTQPGGVEFDGNGFDDDCDGLVDEVEPCPCPTLPLRRAADALQMVDALGLCGAAMSDIALDGDPRQFAVLKGDPWLGRQDTGACLAALSTGVTDPTHPDFRVGGVQPGQSFEVRSPDPADAQELVQDVAIWRLRLTPPPNALGLEYRFMFVSAEWPEYLCHVFNDAFTALLTTDALHERAPTNISFDEDGQRITINTTFFEHPDDWTVDLEVTPFGKIHEAQCLVQSLQPMFHQPGCALPAYCASPESLRRRGSGSGWLTTRAPIAQGEPEIELVFSVHDGSDGLLNSMVLLDGFRWLPWSPAVGTAKE